VRGPAPVRRLVPDWIGQSLLARALASA
jgi:hypothetical protein